MTQKFLLPALSGKRNHSIRIISNVIRTDIRVTFFARSGSSLVNCQRMPSSRQDGAKLLLDRIVAGVTRAFHRDGEEGFERSV